MKISDFDYELPEELIAQTPLEKRDESRLLKLDKNSGNISESKFKNIIDSLSDNDVLVINKTRVIKARLKGRKVIKDPSLSPLSKRRSNNVDIPLLGKEGLGEVYLGREVEIFLHKQISENTWECLVYPGKKLKDGVEVVFPPPNLPLAGEESSTPPPAREGVGGRGETLKAKIVSSTFEGRIVEFNKSGIELLKAIDQLGETPLPPYIKEKLNDSERYQTVFSEIEGSSAAPTASLHFTPELLKKLEEKGVKIEKVLLHVGLGTFFPVLVDDIKDHKMHSEYIELEKEVSKKLNKYKSEGKRIIAVGTTSIRVLETFSDDKGKLSPGKTETDIFIYPGYKWNFTDAMITNFHLPKSTLLMLVSSFAGKENIEKAYKYAVKNKFRFFSFGDAMFIE